MTTKKRILITGATGGVGTRLVEGLGDEYDIIQNGRTAHTPEQEQTLAIADVAHFDEVLPLMEGIDTVIHLAGASSPEADWDSVLSANIVGTRNILEAARQQGVRRVVFASSNHAFGMYDRHENWPVYPDAPMRPDSLYGLSKAFGEVAGRFYHDEHGLEFIALRIGWVADDPLEGDDDVLRAMWLSPRDAIEVHRRAIEADVPFGTYYAISENGNRRWDITNTMLELGYRPQDDWTKLPGANEKVVEGGAPVRDSWPQGS